MYSFVCVLVTFGGTYAINTVTIRRILLFPSLSSYHWTILHTLLSDCDRNATGACFFIFDLNCPPSINNNYSFNFPINIHDMSLNCLKVDCFRQRIHMIRLSFEVNHYSQGIHSVYRSNRHKTGPLS